MLNRGLDKQELLRIVDSVASEKSIDKELILSSMESAIQKAAYSKFGFDNEIEATIDREKGSIKIDGEEINQLPPYTTFNKGIVRTFQIPRELKRMTVLENLMVIKSNQSGENLFTTWFNPWKVRREENDNLSKAEEILDFLYVSDFIMNYFFFSYIIKI